jgi:hypothetical protein
MLHNQTIFEVYDRIKVKVFMCHDLRLKPVRLYQYCLCLFALLVCGLIGVILWCHLCLGPIVANCQYCKRCYGYGYQNGSQHDVGWMDKPKPSAGSYVNLMRC